MNTSNAFDLGILAFAKGMECNPDTDEDFQGRLPAIPPATLSHEVGIDCGFCHRLLRVPTVTKEVTGDSAVAVTCTRCGEIENVPIWRLYGGEAEMRRSWRAGWLSAEALDTARKGAE